MTDTEQAPTHTDRPRRYDATTESMLLGLVAHLAGLNDNSAELHIDRAVNPERSAVYDWFIAMLDDRGLINRFVHTRSADRYWVTLVDPGTFQWKAVHALNEAMACDDGGDS